MSHGCTRVHIRFNKHPNELFWISDEMRIGWLIQQQQNALLQKRISAKLFERIEIYKIIIKLNDMDIIRSFKHGCMKTWSIRHIHYISGTFLSLANSVISPILHTTQASNLFPYRRDWDLNIQTKKTRVKFW